MKQIANLKLIFEGLLLIHCDINDGLGVATATCDIRRDEID